MKTASDNKVVDFQKFKDDLQRTGGVDIPDLQMPMNALLAAYHMAMLEISSAELERLSKSDPATMLQLKVGNPGERGLDMLALGSHVAARMAGIARRLCCARWRNMLRSFL